MTFIPIFRNDGLLMHATLLNVLAEPSETDEETCNYFITERSIYKLNATDRFVHPLSM
jgi:hypothetical protein